MPGVRGDVCKQDLNWGKNLPDLTQDMPDQIYQTSFSVPIMENKYKTKTGKRTPMEILYKVYG